MPRRKLNDPSHSTGIAAPKKPSLAQMTEESFPEPESQDDQQRLREAQRLIGSRRYRYEEAEANTLREFDNEFMRIFGDKRIDQTFTVDALRLVMRNLLADAFVQAPALYDAESARLTVSRTSDLYLSALARLANPQS